MRGQFRLHSKHPDAFPIDAFWIVPTIFAAAVGALMAIVEAVRRERDCEGRMGGGPR
jgi:hypothetical protein